MDYSTADSILALYASAMSKLAASPADVRSSGKQQEDLGRKMRNYGYGGAAGLLAASFVPAVNKKNWARRLVRTGAAASSLGGYMGEAGIRVGKGYQHAANVQEGRAKASKEDGFTISPSAYRSAMAAMKK